MLVLFCCCWSTAEDQPVAIDANVLIWILLEESTGAEEASRGLGGVQPGDLECSKHAKAVDQVM